MHRTHVQHPRFAHPVPVKSNYGLTGAGKTAALVGGAGLVVGIIALPTLVVGPWIVKAFKPEWSYGRRLGASLAFSVVAGTLTQIARAASGSNKAEEAKVSAASSTTSTFVPSSASTAPR